MSHGFGSCRSSGSEGKGRVTSSGIGVSTALRRHASAVVLAAMVLLAVGCIVGSVLASRAAPAAVVSPAPPTSAPVTEIDFADSAEVSIDVRVPAPTPVAFTGRGRVTEWSCLPGADPRSGEVSLRVDDRRVAFLSTRLPLWRDLPVGTTGPDAAGVNDALADLGYDTSGNTTSTATIAAAADLLGAHDVAADGILHASDFAWVPPEGRVDRCTAQPGQFLDEGAEILSVAPIPVTDWTMPTDVLDGARTLTVEGVDVALDDRGRIADASALADVPTIRQAMTEGVSTITVAGVAELVDPLQAFSLPASGIIEDESGETCVEIDEDTVDVQVLGSQLSQTFVTFDSDEVPASVRIGSDRARACH